MNNRNTTETLRIADSPADCPAAEWEAFVAAHPGGTPFQLSWMYEVLAGTVRFEPVVLFARRGGRLVGVLLAVTQREQEGAIGKLTARTVVWGGPLVDGEPAERARAAEALLRALAARTNSIFTEFRNLVDMNELRPVFERLDFDFEEHLNFLVPTNDGDETRRRMSSSRLRQVRKSLKAGAEIIEASTLEEVRAFYDILHDLYVNQIGRPLPDWTFFESFFRIGRTSGSGKYLLVRFEGRVVGGIMCPILPGRAIYEWYICGLDREFRSIHPSVLATWAPIDYGTANELQWFDFMGAGKPDQDYGVREFKSKFGGDLVSFGRFVRINRPLLYRTGRLGLRIRQRLARRRAE